MGTVGWSYRVLAWFVGVVVHTFFRRIEVVGREHVPAGGAVIFAGNHPNALMDGFLVATMCGRRPVHFMGNAKLWRYPLMSAFLDAVGAVPVSPRQGHGDTARRDEPDDTVNNDAAFTKLFEVLEAGSCMGIFPEGVSHTGSQLTRLKTGTARIALAVAARRRVRVTLVPCGLTYTHRHRFRSQALLHFGEPISVDGEWLSAYESSEETTVRAFTDHIADALAKVTLNAPDWETLRFVHAARRLYKPTSVSLTPGTYVELSRRFVEGYLATADSPEIQHLRGDVEDYQAHLDLLGLKDHHLRESVDALDAWNGVLWRSLAVAALLPLAIPGALFHLPIGWVAITAGERLSDGQDDVATLKVITSVLLLPVVYIAVGTMTGIGFGLWWGMAVTTVLPLSFLSLIKVVEVQANMTLATLTNLRLNRFSQEVAGLRATRRHLVDRIRTAVDTHADRSRSRVLDRRDLE